MSDYYDDYEDDDFEYNDIDADDDMDLLDVRDNRLRNSDYVKNMEFGGMEW